MMRNEIEKWLKPIKWYPDGSIRDAIATEAINIETPYGVLIPRYKHDDARQKFAKTISFYPDGVIKSIIPQYQTSLKTSLGDFPAELVTFHKDGSLYRIFPLNGQINGFWSEADEGALAEPINFDLPVGKFSVKLNSIQFYPEGNLKGMSFWPGETIMLKTPQGTSKCRIGFNVYPDGTLKSYEPATPEKVTTKIGDIIAFDYDAIGIHADKNSIVFDHSGEVKAVGTPLTSLVILDKLGDQKRISPKKTVNPLDNEQLLILSTKIAFDDDFIKINDAHYTLDEFKISTHNMTMFSGFGGSSVVSLSL